MSGNKNGYLPCFSKHRDKVFPLGAFYSNSAFVGKLKDFLQAIVNSSDIFALDAEIHPKGGIRKIRPDGEKDDRELCQKLRWVDGEIYRVDYGNVPYRLLFALDLSQKRCYILGLDASHQT